MLNLQNCSIYTKIEPYIRDVSGKIFLLNACLCVNTRTSHKMFFHQQEFTSRIFYRTIFLTFRVLNPNRLNYSFCSRSRVEIIYILNSSDHALIIFSLTNTSDQLSLCFGREKCRTISFSRSCKFFEYLFTCIEWIQLLNLIHVNLNYMGPPSRVLLWLWSKYSTDVQTIDLNAKFCMYWVEMRKPCLLTL